TTTPAACCAVPSPRRPPCSALPHPSRVPSRGSCSIWARRRNGCSSSWQELTRFPAGLRKLLPMNTWPAPPNLVFMRILIALGGNAMTSADGRATPTDQIAAIKKAASPVAELVAQGHELLLTHGNGPQVGNLLV